MACIPLDQRGNSVPEHGLAAAAVSAVWMIEGDAGWLPFAAASPPLLPHGEEDPGDVERHKDERRHGPDEEHHPKRRCKAHRLFVP